MQNRGRGSVVVLVVRSIIFRFSTSGLRRCLCIWLAGPLIGAVHIAQVQAGEFDQLRANLADGRSADNQAAIVPAEGGSQGHPGTQNAQWAPVLDAVDMVKAMADAMKSLNYEGTFVHVQGSHVTSMSVLHASEFNGEYERLWALDGEAREVFRDNDKVICIWPASESVLVSKSRPRELSPEFGSLLSMSDRYTFRFGPSDRVAGVATHVVHVEPADSHRYGYRFWIDKRNYMLLRSMLLDGQRPVEQMLFTFIQYPEQINPARFDVSQDSKRISWLEPKQVDAASGVHALAEEAVDRIDFHRLPAGYREVSETLSVMPINDKPVSHAMISDGMASVSVYVEYAIDEADHQGMEGSSSMGAANAFSLRDGDLFITAVGEVPAETVKQIALSVRIR